MAHTVDAPKLETITLVGGPGDGEKHQWKSDSNLLRWVPKTREEEMRVTAAGFAGNPRNHHLQYRRSLRTRSKFVFQP